MTQFKRQQLKKIRCLSCSNLFEHYYSLMQRRRAKHQDKYAALVQLLLNLTFLTKFPDKDFLQNEAIELSIFGIERRIMTSLPKNVIGNKRGKKIQVKSFN